MTRHQLPKLKRYAWTGETRTMRVPNPIHDPVKAIAQWADKQPDPVAAMQRVLEWIESQKSTQ